MKLLVTGSSGLIGSEVVDYFCRLGWKVHGVDNNMRADFFGPGGDTRWNQQRLSKKHAAFHHHEMDIRAREKVLDFLASLKPDMIVHTAAQPSHDLAASRPFDDFDVNRPNSIALKELTTRWDYDDPVYSNGISETFPIDQSKHSLFGASKVAADIMVQEYGRYFGMKTCCLRGGCLTGPNHSGVELHGFLSYLVKCNAEGQTYKVYGYKGKQVRDNIHSLDVARFIHAFAGNPRYGEVYNIGGGRANSCSILEAFDRIAALSGKKMNFEYVDKNREGDHICYISDLGKMKAHYPDWDITKSLDDIFSEIYEVTEASKSRK
jgi:CDP-paratose 2-epimerase